MPSPIDRCAKQRAAVTAQEQLINSLHSQKVALQQSLQQAGPGAKAGIVLEIKRISALIVEAEARLPKLKAALEACKFPASQTKGTGKKASGGVKA